MLHQVNPDIPLNFFYMVFLENIMSVSTTQFLFDPFFFAALPTSLKTSAYISGDLNLSPYRNPSIEFTSNPLNMKGCGAKLLSALLGYDEDDKISIIVLNLF